jgi:hypothetical protein
MKPLEAFGIVARTLGLLFVLSSLATLFYALADLALGELGIGVIAWTNYGVPALAVGVGLLVTFGLLYPSLVRITGKKRAVRETSFTTRKRAT